MCIIFLVFFDDKIFGKFLQLERKRLADLGESK